MQGKQGRYREVTVASVIFGVVVGGIMNAAITYAGLKIGFTIVGSAIAAVLGFGVLRGILRKGSILETNIGQTIASGVNTSNAGIIFTVPVLMILPGVLPDGLRFDDPNFWWITLACIAGTLLGVVFIVPLRKQMLDVERLRFPSATAVAAILKSPGAGAAKSVVLAVGIVVGMLAYLPAGLPQIRVPVELSEAGGLVERERLSPAEAELATRIDGWIALGMVPPLVAERGELVLERREALAGRDEARAAAISEHVAALPPEVRGYPETLAVAAHRVASGELAIERLREPDHGWPTRPLMGYQDLGVRLTQGSQENALRWDRNGDDRPDLVVSDDQVNVGRVLGLPDDIQLIFAIAPFAIGAGYLTGRAGLVVLAGGLLAYMVLNPVAYRGGWLPEAAFAHQAPGLALGAFNRPLGIGLLLGGALMGILAALPAMREAIKSLMRAGKGGGAAGAEGAGGVGGHNEMSMRSLLTVAAIGMVLLLVALEMGGSTGAADVGGLLGSWGFPPMLVRAVIAVVGAAWIWFAGIIIAQCTGMTDWSPISGMALLTVVLVMALAGGQDVVSAVILGAALCVAIACASDMMSDLKTGYLVGASPRRQQWVEVLTAVIGPLITMSTLVLIAGVNMKQVGIPIGPGTPTVAPQAQALQAVITGVQGGEMPYALYGLGGILGVLLGIAVFPGLGVLVGLSMYLPVHYILTYGLGCIANIIVARVKGRAWAEEWGVPFCAGLIVGEAVLALTINSIVLIRG